MRRSVTIAVLVLLALALLPATVAQAAWRARVTVPGPTIQFDVPPAPTITKCENVSGLTLGLVGGTSKITWDWTYQRAAEFRVYLARSGSTPSAAPAAEVGESVRSWTVSAGLLDGLLGGLTSTTLTVTVTAVINGVEFAASGGQRVSYTLLPLATVQCVS